MTQRNYFSSGYIGCDRQTGLGLPDWEKLFAAWGVPTMRIDGEGRFDQGFQAMFDQPGVAAFIVSIDADQTYFPKITSRMTESGTMESNPLHLMTPDLSEEQYRDVVQFL
jgi:acetolactate synthase-1/2/3 large subunit